MNEPALATRVRGERLTDRQELLQPATSFGEPLPRNLYDGVPSELWFSIRRAYYKGMADAAILLDEAAG